MAGSMYGPLFIGLTLNCILYGATVVQTFIYFQTFKSDKWWMKLFAFYLLFFETLNTVFDIGTVYEPLIIRNGTSEASTIAPTMSDLKCCQNEFIDSMSKDPLTTVMISLPVQLFIAWRVKVMSRSYVLPVAISVFAITSFAGGIATGVTLALIDFQYSQFPHNDRYVIIWLVSSAAADVVITVSLVHSLLRKRTGFAATDDVINRIIRLTIQTGSLTAVSATLDVTMYFLLRVRKGISSSTCRCRNYIRTRFFPR
ncbi:hypothetical protein L210DRAFT_3627426 [Boletus edulis BED1]|uniref:DUF6534 domain-containing protein n=1 Tax=Boletus edulis BED1 TaxID=1328754 RepID=A0AAD4C5N1_BOLED|nr:hypothetical protein L210DRAFT_3627426 [Boletus edulis BED1]